MQTLQTFYRSTIHLFQGDCARSTFDDILQHALLKGLTADPN